MRVYPLVVRQDKIKADGKYMLSSCYLPFDSVLRSIALLLLTYSIAIVRNKYSYKGTPPPPQSTLFDLRFTESSTIILPAMSTSQEAPLNQTKSRREDEIKSFAPHIHTINTTINTISILYCCIRAVSNKQTNLACIRWKKTGFLS